jgi:hypothetical protein
MASHPLEQLRSDDIVFESLPDDVLATLQVRAAWFKRLPPAQGGQEFVLADLQRWTPGQKVRVAFLGGSTALHKEIADATVQITQNCNLTLDFGLDPQTGTYRSWSTSDQTHVAEIRVSFDQGGYFSLVGTDSIDVNVGGPFHAVGGRAGQRSLNLGGFHIQKPSNWRGVVRHEFMHALAFHHEHQNMRGPCEMDFRWDDDPGYEPTTDAQGRFVPDAAARRPGIYTYLAGFPNFWAAEKVDFNLRTTNDPNAVASVFDPASVMLYRFPALFYKTAPSPCAPSGDGLELSQADIRGLQLLYPGFGGEFQEIVAHRRDLIGAIDGSAAADMTGEESGAADLNPFARQARRILLDAISHI